MPAAGPGQLKGSGFSRETASPAQEASPSPPSIAGGLTPTCLHPSAAAPSAWAWHRLHGAMEGGWDEEEDEERVVSSVELRWDGNTAREVGRLRRFCSIQIIYTLQDLHLFWDFACTQRWPRVFWTYQPCQPLPLPKAAVLLFCCCCCCFKLKETPIKIFYYFPLSARTETEKKVTLEQDPGLATSRGPVTVLRADVL